MKPSRSTGAAYGRGIIGLKATPSYAQIGALKLLFDMLDMIEVQLLSEFKGCQQALRLGRVVAIAL
jgi:hypothetical protein